mmetsp:Transcript_27386/g.28497  ORF Transcript_27386/g.28497 Transcript_27386/m.28497 type:complete len:348 (+) Transcript_27386:23-1066(+)
MEKTSNQQLNVLLWGFGHMNKIVLRYVVEKGHNVVGVIGRHNIGEDAFVVAGYKDSPFVKNNRTKEVKIISEQQAEEAIKSYDPKPEACILATRSTMIDIEPALRVLGNNSIDVTTIAEECFYPVNTSPSIYQSLDALYKEKGVSFTGTGVQDILWGIAPGTAIGAQHTVNKILGLIQYNVDDYGRALCEAHGVGMTVDQFNKEIASSEVPAYNWNSNEFLASMFDWKIKETKQKLIPMVVEKEINSKSLDGSIKGGDVSGMKCYAITECENGIIIESEMIGRVYHGEMSDVASFKISGEPNSEIMFNQPATAELTCASAVNRLEQIVNARSGFVPTYELGIIPWRK